VIARMSTSDCRIVEKKGDHHLGFGTVGRRGKVAVVCLPLPSSKQEQK